MILTLRIECITGAYLNERCVRVIEIDEDASLYDLHNAIQDAVDFGRDHPYQFYTARNWNGKKRCLTQKEEWEAKMEDFPFTRLRDIYPLKNGKLYYWFDFGDRWIFEIRKLRGVVEPEIGVCYPRLVESIGPNPEQYPRLTG